MKDRVMTLIIDGYNVLKYHTGDGFITEKQRLAFIADLAKYLQDRKVKPLVIFDGGPTSRPSCETYYGIAIVYAGSGISADAYIQDYIDNNYGKEMVLVSSDNALQQYADQRTIASIDTPLFLLLMAAHASKNSDSQQNKKSVIITKTSKESNSDLDNLIYEHSNRDPKKNATDDATVCGINGQHHSKLARKLAKKIKKLL